MVENAVIESLKTRRAVRGYADRPVEREKLDAILEAATYAPTGMGAQSPVIVLVESKEVRDKVAALNAGVMGRDIDRRRLRGRCQLYPGLRRRPCARAEASQGRVREDRLVGERWGSVPRGERVVMFKSPFSRWCEASCSIDV